MCYLAWFSVPQIETKNFFLDLSCMTFDPAINDKELSPPQKMSRLQGVQKYVFWG